MYNFDQLHIADPPKKNLSQKKLLALPKIKPDAFILYNTQFSSFISALLFDKIQYILLEKEDKHV